jgi:hypothetical protein
MAFSLKEADSPEAAVMTIPESKAIDRKLLRKDKRVRVLFDVYGAVNTPDKEGTYQVSARFGSKEVMTDKKKAQNGLVTFNQSLEFTFSFYGDQPAPDIYIYLLNGSK